MEGKGSISNLSGRGSIGNLSGQALGGGGGLSCETLAGCAVIIGINDSITGINTQIDTILNSPGYAIDYSDISNWDTALILADEAYGWGNHALAGYATVGGTDGQLQYNNNGVLAGVPLYFANGDMFVTLEDDNHIDLHITDGLQNSEFYQDKSGLYFQTYAGSKFTGVDITEDYLNLYAIEDGTTVNTIRLTGSQILFGLLAGTGTRAVVADSTGYLSTTALGTMASQNANNVTITGGTITASSITNTGLTAGRIPIVGTGGLMTDSSTFLYDSKGDVTIGHNATGAANIRLNIRTAGTATASTWAIVSQYANGNNIFSARADGRLDIGSGGNFFTATSDGSGSSLAGRGWLLHAALGSAATGALRVTGGSDILSGASWGVKSSVNFSPSSGSATFAGFHYDGGLSQTGTATGATYAFRAQASLSNLSGSTISYYAFHTNNNLGWAYYAEGTATSYFGGNTGFGTATNLTAWAVFGASTTAKASLRILTGVAPTSPNNGDVWQDGTNLYIRINGVTKTVSLT